MRKTLFSLLAIGALLFLFSDAALAVTFTDIATNVTGHTKSMGSMVKTIGILAGFIMVLIGLAGVANAKKSQQPLSTPITVLVLGVLLVSVILFTKSGSESVFGSEGSGLSDLGL